MKDLKKYYTINLAITTTIYLVSVFVKWDFFIPLQWILNIPNFTMGERGLFLFVILLYSLTQWLFYNNIKAKFKNENYLIPFFVSLLFFIIILLCILLNY